LPRKYDLGKRVAQQADTRRRIIDAATELYLERGVASTTMRDVALRADVAPGTVANHFGSASALGTEVTSRLFADMEMPTPELFDGIEGLPDRIHLMVRQLAAFFDRIEPWYWVSQREGPAVQVWADAEARFYRDLEALIRAALGPLADDADAVAVVIAIIGGWVIGRVQASGRTSEQAVDLVAELLSAWLATRAR
jgi:AcrR family transcriptional regulator